MYYSGRMPVSARPDWSVLMAGSTPGEPALNRRSRHRRPEKLSESLARDIVRDMRRLPPDTMLPTEVDMAKAHGVGRGSVREALRILETHGLITIRTGPRGGPVVAQPDSETFAKMASLHLHTMGATYRDLIQSRLVMEPVMARLAAERQDQAVLKQLEDYVGQTAPVKDEEYLHSVSNFHSLVSGMSTNPVLDLYGRSLKDIYTDRIESMVFPVEARARVRDDHAAIARLIVEGEADRAEKRMREHMSEFLTFSAERNPGLLDRVVDWQ